jgi:hypothetical protein
MITEKIAQRIKALCAEKRFSEARQQLFAEDAVSVEADGTTRRGLHELEAKHTQWLESMTALHEVQVSEPLVNENRFAIGFTWDVTYHNQPRTMWHEIGVFHVKEGKVVHEQFFY